MKKIKSWIKIVKEYFDYSKKKRYDTLAGTVSFFFLLSFIPLLYLCLSVYIYFGTIFGLETPIPDVVKDYISFDLNAGASIFFFLTTIYSASKFFIQLKKTGEIIYEVKQPRVNIKSTVFACILVVFSMLVVSVGLLSISLAKFYLSHLTWAQILIQLATYLAIGGMFYALIVVVNKFGCPIDHIKIKMLQPGILFSFIYAILLSSLFGIYLKFTSYDALYGYFATVIIAAIYVNFLMQGIIAGIIINEKRVHPLFEISNAQTSGDVVKGIIGKFKPKKNKEKKK